MQSGVKLQFRDRIAVKGKDKLIPTYFVKLNDSLEVEFRNDSLGVESVTTQLYDY
jgi:hypothetical protein